MLIAIFHFGLTHAFYMQSAHSSKVSRSRIMRFVNSDVFIPPPECRTLCQILAFQAEA